MRVVIKGEAKEIAALLLEIAERRDAEGDIDKIVQSLSKLLADGKMRRREDDQILETSHRRSDEREACDADRYKRTIHR